MQLTRHRDNKTNHIDANINKTSENRSNHKANNRRRSICRLDRKGQQQKCWSRCNWKSFMASVIIVLMHLTSIECLQARQEGELSF